MLSQLPLVVFTRTSLSPGTTAFPAFGLPTTCRFQASIAPFGNTPWTSSARSLSLRMKLSPSPVPSALLRVNPKSTPPPSKSNNGEAGELARGAKQDVASGVLLRSHHGVTKSSAKDMGIPARCLANGGVSTASLRHSAECGRAVDAGDNGVAGAASACAAAPATGAAATRAACGGGECGSVLLRRSERALLLLCSPSSSAPRSK
mmetsp:Transcript_50018/g.116095  ORF Transcript_50018/g.116095 Transcript_50018/m.116095 type:complete len:205 (-) Transcript_50018:152-766(-)|eukprot:CAMPEP_0171061446 /NCGR_PEP_ID=MMETSP0766_2-20121228/4436_1 /TAXON_ID=439317 /ORGANISM="Gambierdiscus australes, Strain CAWD 149" /LENGTH=204 /DNA_ID=CAMNT_0011517129 /DNA_START=522 /DNA_END=1136 /DNA_ORIENTATION=-